MTMPGAPGDLKIGIPGIGSISIPTGWITQAFQFATMAANVASGMTGSVLTSCMQYAAMTTNLAVYNAGAAVSTAVNSGTYTLAQIIPRPLSSNRRRSTIRRRRRRELLTHFYGDSGGY